MATEAARPQFATTADNWLDRLARAVDEVPRRTLAALLAIHVALWGLIPALVSHNLPLDMIEQLAWGREWQWSYFKHPPLPAWVDEAVAHLSGGWDRPLFFIGPFATALALWLIWRLAADILGRRASLLAVLLEEAVLYFTFFSPEFNHNVIQLPLWALIGWLGRRAILRDRTADWIALGIAAGLGMLGKYSTAFLLLTYGLFLLAEPTTRGRYRTARPWIALTAMIAVLIPHILALGAVDYGPLRFPFMRTSPPSSWWDHLLYPLNFAGAQLLDALGAILLIGMLIRDRRREPAEDASPLPATTTLDRRYVAAMCWGPLAMTVMIAAVFGLKMHAMWGAPFLNYIGLFTMMFVTPGPRRLSRRFVVLWLILFIGTLAAFPIQFALQPLLHLRPLRGEFPGRALARAVDRGWHRAEGDRPLRYVAGWIWPAGNVSFALWHERPSVMINGDPVKSPWIDRAKLACSGAVLLWNPGHSTGKAALLARFPDANIQPEITLPVVTWGPPQYIHVPWAIVPPKGNCDAAGKS